MYIRIIDEYLECTQPNMRSEKRGAKPNKEGMPNVQEFRNNCLQKEKKRLYPHG